MSTHFESLMCPFFFHVGSGTEIEIQVKCLMMQMHGKEILKVVMLQSKAVHIDVFLLQ